MKLLILSAILTIAATAASASNFSQAHADSQHYFKTEEPQVKDALWTTRHTFKVGVLPNPRHPDRHGYAEYVCGVLYEYGFKGRGVKVHVIDIVQLARHGKWVKLGETRCR